MKDIKMNLTMNNHCIETNIPIDENLTFEDFFFALQILLANLKENINKITTFDIYDLSFERIALVGNNNELFISPKFKNLHYATELFDLKIDTIEVISLGTTSAKKVLEEERQLDEALKNYKF